MPLTIIATCLWGLSYASNFVMLHFFHVALFSCFTFSMLHVFHVALFSCCTLFMLHFFNVEKYWKWTRHRKHNQKTTLHAPPWTWSLSFWYPIAHFIHSFEWLIKWKGTNLLFCLERMCLPRLETFETRTWNFSPT